ncbi:flagellar hook-length control protein FliK [Thiorhodovibrio frisius]|uniref:Flagellar hook-length control protein n=1 Tax=Thiorhodovibrio frisius TaxID=631362 RepID=H8YZN5_9GAMM|nr:flagellar hook-length control protein FliK [Thiorhodovibrio frisius]EIC22162.1 flagellar hook-length control protein [Thiorhodovibrio frisius]WPL24456.1 Flagellar hook-length control protein FliK [Thiorhodovibrio frisius]
MTDPSQVNARVNTGSLPARVPDTSGAAQTARAASEQARETTTRLTTGSRVDVQVKAVQQSGDLEVRLRTQGEGTQRGQWSQTMRVGVTDSLRPALLDALRTLAAGQGRGGMLSAEVVSLTPRVMLRLMHSDGEGAPGTKAWFNAQLRNHLPGARQLSTTFADWTRGLREAGVDRGAPSPLAHQRELTQLVKQVLERLASPRELTDPARLAESLRNSGIWLEALLARAGSQQGLSLDADLKAQLLRLAGKVRLQQGPDLPAAGADRLAHLSASLSREVDGMLKQLVTLQLQNAENGPDQQRWTVELPFQTSAGLLTLDADIQREAEQEADQGEHWSMQIRLDLPVLGPLLIRLGLRDNRLHASLVAEQGASAALLRERLPELRAQLEGRDIEIASLHAREGRTERKPPARAPLLREQA